MQIAPSNFASQYAEPNDGVPSISEPCHLDRIVAIRNRTELGSGSEEATFGWSASPGGCDDDFGLLPY